MSGSLTPTVAATPNTVQVATQLLALMASLNGAPTDYNEGSQIRTLSEAIGAVTEIEGVGSQALAFQALLYGAMSAFGIQQPSGTVATGTVTFTTSIPVSAAPIAPQSVPIPINTLLQSTGGVQFETTAAATLASGTASVNVPIQAVQTGANGNLVAGAILGTPQTSLGYPLFVINNSPTGGGSDPGSFSSALAQFTSKVNSIGLSSPVAVANAVIGVVSSGTGETVQFSSVYEPWIAAGSGAGSGTAGFTLYVDNGTGTASPSLLAAVTAWINGSVNANQSGYRPAGVPYIVSATTAVYATAVVSGVLFPGLLATGSVVSSVTSGIVNYFSALGIAPAAAYQSQVAAEASDAALGAFQSLTASIFYSGSATPVTVVSGGVGTRVILASLSVNIQTGS